MPLYDVIVTADVTESAVIRVEGDSIRDASYKALDEARLNGPKYDWQRDEGNCWQPYLGDEDGATLVDDDTPPPPKAPVPHATVVQIAEAHRELTLLHMRQATTMATMIDACLSRLDRKPTGFERTEDLQRNRRERAEALKGLRDLSAMLKSKGVRDPDTIDQRN